MIRTTLVLGAVLGALLTGCYKVDYTNGASSGGYADTDVFHHRLLFGLVELGGPVRLDQICPNGFTKIHTETGLVHGLIQYVVGAFVPVGYSPNSVQVWCEDGTAYNATLDEDGLVQTLELMD